MQQDKLLKEFGVRNHEELMEYMEKHPEDDRVIELYTIFDYIERLENEEKHL